MLRLFSTCDVPSCSVMLPSESAYAKLAFSFNASEGTNHVRRFVKLACQCFPPVGFRSVRHWRHQSGNMLAVAVDGVSEDFVVLGCSLGYSFNVRRRAKGL